MEVGAYLPSYHTVSIYFLKGKFPQPTVTTCADIISGQKKHVKSSKIRYLYIPHYEGCNVRAILEQAAHYPEVEAYLPEAREHAQLPRQWIINIVFTVGGDDFARWAQRQQDWRNQKMAAEHNLMIEMDPAILKVFQESK